ncbi:hypothetical protein GR130_15955 [Streptomyces sp. GS7]|nr:hypothetical protein GR130_15955 [Streptomyces sp. GS7]
MAATLTDGQRQAKRPVSAPLTGPYGHPFRPILVTVPIGAWVASPVFDTLDGLRLLVPVDHLTCGIRKSSHPTTSRATTAWSTTTSSYAPPTSHLAASCPTTHSQPSTSAG